MNSNIDLLEKYMPPDNPGYQFVKRTVSYIPVREVGLSVLVRKNQSISFVYETVLKFLQIEINDIPQLCAALGLDIDVFKEIISKMAVEDLIYVSENQMGLTKKGSEALKSLTKVTIEKVQLNRVFVNLVTGELYLNEPAGLRQRPLPSSMYLDETVAVDVNYFHSHFEHIVAIHELSLLSNILGLDSVGTVELYRILDIAYQETRFLPVTCFVYAKPSTHEIIFTFDNDKDSVLMSAALMQMKEQSNGIEKLFDRPLPSSALDDSVELMRRLSDLLSILDLRNKSKVSVQEIEESYYTDRLLLDGEVHDMLVQCDSFKPSSLCLCTPFLHRLSEDNEISYNLMHSRAKDIFIEYNADEYKAEDSVKRLTEKMPDGKNLHLCPVGGPTKITEDTFIIYPRALIKTYYENIETGTPQKVLHKPTSTITFDKSKIDEAYSHYSNDDT